SSFVHSFVLYHHPTLSDLYSLSLHDALPIWSEFSTIGSVLDTDWISNTKAYPTDFVNPPPALGSISNCGLGPAKSVDIRIRLQRSEEHTSELQSRENLVCRLLLEKKKINKKQ